MRYLFIIVAIVGTLTYACGNVIDVSIRNTIARCRRCLRSRGA